MESIKWATNRYLYHNWQSLLWNIQGSGKYREADGKYAGETYFVMLKIFQTKVYSQLQSLNWLYTRLSILFTESTAHNIYFT